MFFVGQIWGSNEGKSDVHAGFFVQGLSHSMGKKKHQHKNDSQKTNFLIEWGLSRWVLCRFSVSLAGRSHQSTDLDNSTPKVRNRGSQPAKQTDPLD